MRGTDDHADTLPVGRQPEKRRPRAGWADAFGDIEELGDEDRAWLGFGNEGDHELGCVEI